MNSNQAKAVPLPEFLERLGFVPTQVRGNDIWYKSPFRPDERTPSFKIDRAKNIWYDHGLGAGGTVIDFVQHLNQTHDISRVLDTIAGILDRPAQTRIILPNTEVPRRDAPVIEAVGTICDPVLEKYLALRAIPLDLARLYLKEMAYQVDGQHYRALAFPNRSGGFEVRNPNFKGSIGKKDISYLAYAGNQHAAVFEGFFDFLSVLAHYKREQANANVLVLNSLALMERGTQHLSESNTKKVYAYLDHDEAGRTATEKLRSSSSWDFVDASNLYLGHKDMNAMLS